VAVRLAQAATSLSGGPSGRPDGVRWTCAFVNNMPDGAFEATERQFLGLLDAGSGTDDIEVRRYAMAGVPRGERTATLIAQDYSPPASIRHHPPDLLVVTGSNPLEERIEDEPYWAELADLLSWGSEHADTLVLSCLSAHAGLKIFDGVERERLPAKCTGVFLQEADGAHPLSAGLGPEVPLPHSRVSSVPEAALLAAGYRIAVQSDEVGWAVATRTVGRANVVLVQGHPEYDPSSLLREYHRDARRYVLHERDELPRLPWHCVAPEDWGPLEELHRAITGDRRDPQLIESYPFDDVGARATWPWRSVATQLYANLLAGVSERND
jgi:homoserine O-succinyltransferase/O-acetyltransferase